MPRLLMLAHWFPPCGRWPTAAKRAEGFARHLPEFGWDTVVIAPDLDAHGLCDCGADHGAPVPGIEVRRIPLRPARLAALDTRSGQQDDPGGQTEHTAGPIQMARATARTLFESRGRWLTDARRSLDAELASGSFDAIWTTSGPSSSAVVGARVSRQHQLPWIADLRDPISSVIVPTQAHPGPQRLVRRLGAIRALRQADAVVATSHASARLDAAALGRHVDTIHSGVALEEIVELTQAAPTHDADAVLLTGAIYPDGMAVSVITQGIAELRRRATPVHVHYFGTDGAALAAAARADGVQDLVHDHGFRPVSEINDWARRTRATLILELVTGATRIPGKVFEFAALGVPVVVVPGEHAEIRSILDAAGSHALPAANSTDFADAVAQFAPLSDHAPNPDFSLTRRNAAKSLSGLLNAARVGSR